MIDMIEDQWQKMNEATQILDRPQFLMPDVCAITGATSKALEHFLNPKREMVRLMGSHVNPGTGKRRMFTGEQVLMIAAAYAMNKIGFPQRWSIPMSETVARRAKHRLIGLARETGFTILTYPMANGDWAVTNVYLEREDEPKLPVAVQVLDADRLIDETLSQLRAIAADEEMPDFSVPDPEPEPNPYSPKSNFFRAWEKDESDRWVYVGLDFEETEMLLKDRGSRVVGDDLEIVTAHMPRERDPEKRALLEELYQRHEEERLKRCGFEMEE